MSRILSVSSSRADIGALAPVWRALAATPASNCMSFSPACIWWTTPRRAPLCRRTPSCITAAPISAALRRSLAAAAMARIEADAGALLGELRPDLVLVMGDRLDMLPAATATLPFNLPLAHLHGGEITEGAVDDRIRHALSKLAHVHCVSTQGARAAAAGDG